MLSSLAKCKVREKTTLRQFVKNKVRETLSDLGNLDSTDYTQNMIPKSKTDVRRYSSNKVKNAHYIMSYDVTSFDATQKNVIIFDFLAPGAFQRYIG